MSNIDFLAEGLTNPPKVLRGLTVSEIVILALLSIMFWFPTGIILGSLFWTWMMGLALSIICLILTIFLFPILIDRFRRDKPLGYYGLLLKIKMLKTFGFNNNLLVPRVGPLDVGRKIK